MWILKPRNYWVRTEINWSMTWAVPKRIKTVSRNSSSFKLYRQVDFNHLEPPTNGQKSSEMREEAPREEGVMRGSQANVEDPSTTTNSNKDVPDSSPPSGQQPATRRPIASPRPRTDRADQAEDAPDRYQASKVHEGALLELNPRWFRKSSDEPKPRGMQHIHISSEKFNSKSN